MIRLMQIIIVIIYSCGILDAQDISLGIAAKTLPSFTEVGIVKNEYNLLNSFGGGIMLHFTQPFSFSTGVQVYYGMKNLLMYKPESDPDAPDDVGPRFGAERNIYLLEFEIPFMYSLSLKKFLHSIPV